MRIRITQLDGDMPNLALMRFGHWHRVKGDDVVVSHEIHRGLYERDDYDRVYGSAIFKYSVDEIADFRRQWPNAIIGVVRNTVSE